MDLPIKNSDFPVRYVSLPEGNPFADMAFCDQSMVHPRRSQSNSHVMRNEGTLSADHGYSGYTIWLFNSLPWKIPKINGGLVRWGNHLFLWAMASMAMLNNQSIRLSMNLPRRMMIYFILSVTYRIIEYVHPSYKHVTTHRHIPIALLRYTRYTYRCTDGLPLCMRFHP